MEQRKYIEFPITSIKTERLLTIFWKMSRIKRGGFYIELKY